MESWIDPKEYPFESRYIKIGGKKMHYIDQGTGPVLLFVHGTPSWSFEWRHIINALQLNYRCIAIDHIGFGLSEKPKEFEYSTVNLTANLQEFVKALNLENIVLAVHDFGGPVGLGFAIAHPKTVSRIIILNSWLWSMRDEPGYPKLKKAASSRLLRFLYLYLNFSPEFLLPRSFTKRPTRDILRHYSKPFPCKDTRYGMLGLLQSLAGEQEHFDNLWAKSGVLQNKPALLLWGMDDPFMKPKFIKRFQQLFLNCRTVELFNCGHFPQEEATDEVIDSIMDFLNHSRQGQ